MQQMVKMLIQTSKSSSNLSNIFAHSQRTKFQMHIGGKDVRTNGHKQHIQ
jgi:hypothetical protein